MQNDNAKKRIPWQIVLVIGVVLVAMVLGIGRLIAGDTGGGTADPLVQIEEPACTAAGGEWNSCGSPCRGTDSEFCIQVCVGQCMCESNEDCPFGYECSDKIDGKGICKKL
tara:strand:- start:321 stop:653 length:333 start_codon:yes stop_codon:yes gene_type:complete